MHKLLNNSQLSIGVAPASLRALPFRLNSPKFPNSDGRNMKTGKESKPGGNIHREQLFHWIGRHVDDRNKGRKILSDDLAAEVVAMIGDSLANGLWVKTPRYPETFTSGGKTFSLDLPIACFTEWSLGDSLPHTMEYGRIGFGFPKRWVIGRGGQSVTYFRHNEKGPFLKSIFRLLAQHGRFSADTGWTMTPASEAGDELRYLLHFAKMIRLKPRRVVKPGKGAEKEFPAEAARRRKPARPASPARQDAQTYQRRFGHPLEFVEEREWRIVHNGSGRHFVKGRNPPDYFLPYTPGEDLFTLIVPDHKVLSRVLESTGLTGRLFTPWRHYPGLGGRRVPPVTLLSHSDLGTF
jgi:hypothetical protein